MTSAPKQMYLGGQQTVRKIPKTLAAEGRLSLRKQSYLNRKMAIIPLMQANSAGPTSPVHGLAQMNHSMNRNQGQLLALSEPQTERNNTHSGFDKIYRTQTDSMTVDRQRQNSMPEGVHGARTQVQSGALHSANLAHFASSIERRLVDIYGPLAYETAVKLGARLPQVQQKQQHQLQLEGQRVSNLRTKKHAFHSDKLVGSNQNEHAMIRSPHLATQVILPEKHDLTAELAKSRRMVAQDDLKIAEDNRYVGQQQVEGTQFYSYQAQQKLRANSSNRSGVASIQSMPPDTTRLARTQNLTIPLVAMSTSSSKAYELVLNNSRVKPVQAMNGHQHKQMNKLMNLTDMSEILLQSQQQLNSTTDNVSLQHQQLQQHDDKDQLESYFPTSLAQNKLSTTQRLASSRPSAKKNENKGTIFASLMPTYMKQQITIDGLHSHRKVANQAATTSTTSRIQLQSLGLSSNNTGEQIYGSQEGDESEEPLEQHLNSADKLDKIVSVKSGEQINSKNDTTEQAEKNNVEQSNSPHFGQPLLLQSCGSDQQDEEKVASDGSVTDSPRSETNIQYQNKMKADVLDLAILASSARINAPLHMQELQPPVLNGQLAMSRKDRAIQARFKSPYEQRLPLLAIKGEIKNQLFKKQQYPGSTSNQQNQPQHELPQVVTSFKNQTTSISTPTHQSTKLKKIPGQPGPLEATKEKQPHIHVTGEEEEKQQQLQQQQHQQNAQNHKQVIPVKGNNLVEEQLQMNKNAIQLQPVPTKQATNKSLNAPQARNVALDGAVASKHHQGSLGAPLQISSSIATKTGIDLEYANKHANALLYRNSNGNAVRGGANTSINQKTAASPTSPAALTQSACYAQQWSPLKPGSKSIANESIFTVQSKEQHLLGDEKLSPMRTFMEERNAQTNHLHGFSEYIATALTAYGPENHHRQHNSVSTAPNDILGQVMKQALSTQANTTAQPRQGQPKTISALQKTSSPNSGSKNQQNMTLVQGKLLQNAKTRQYKPRMAVHASQLVCNDRQQQADWNSRIELSHTMPGVLPNSGNDQRNAGAAGAMAGITTIPQSTNPSRMKQESAWELSMMRAPAQQNSFIVLEKSFKPHLSHIHTSVPQNANKFQRVTNGSRTAASSSTSKNNNNAKSDNAVGSQQRHLAVSSQLSPFIIDCNQPPASMVRSPTSSKPTSLTKLQQQKPLNEVRQSKNLAFKNQVVQQQQHNERQQSLLGMVVPAEIVDRNDVIRINGDAKAKPTTDPLIKTIGQYGPSANEYFGKTTAAGSKTQKAQKNSTELKRIVGSCALGANPQIMPSSASHFNDMAITKISHLKQPLLTQIDAMNTGISAKAAAILRKSADKSSNCTMMLPAFINSSLPQQVTSSAKLLKQNKNEEKSEQQIQQQTAEQSIAMITQAVSSSPRKSRKASQNYVQSQQANLTDTRDRSGMLLSFDEAQAMNEAKASRIGIHVNTGVVQPKTTHLDGRSKIMTSVHGAVHSSTENLNGRASSLQVGASKPGDNARINGLVQSSDSARQLSDARYRDRYGTTRNKQVNNHTCNMNTNSSDDEESHVNHDIPLSQNHSEDNLNVQSSKINDVHQDKQQSPNQPQHTQPSYVKDDKSGREQQASAQQRRSSHKPAKTTKAQHQSGSGFNSYNRGRRVKRKQLARSIISSKPSLNSNFSRVNNFQADTPQKQQQQMQPSQHPQVQVGLAKTITTQAVVTTGPIGQAFPAVHDLSGKKFVKDSRRIEQYYQTASKAKQHQDDEYSSQGQIPVLSDNGGGINAAGGASMFGGSSRAGKTKVKKDSHSMGGGASNQPLSSMKSQGKIVIKKSSGAIATLRGQGGKQKRDESMPTAGLSVRKLRMSVQSAAQDECRSGTIQSSGTANDRGDGAKNHPRSQWSHHDLPNSSAMCRLQKSLGSQRCNSAMRSTQQLQAAPSSSTAQQENIALRSSGGIRQPYKFSQHDSGLSSKSRPRTVTKAVSAASVGPSSSGFSRKNSSVALVESKRQPAAKQARKTNRPKGITAVTEYNVCGKEAQTTTCEVGKQTVTAVLGPKKSLSKPQGSNSINQSKKQSRAGETNASNTLTQNTVELKQPLTVVTNSLKKSSQPIYEARSPTLIPKQLISKKAGGVYNSGEKSVLKVSQIKRVSQIQYSQQALDIKDLSPTKIKQKPKSKAPLTSSEEVDVASASQASREVGNEKDLQLSKQAATESPQKQPQSLSSQTPQRLSTLAPKPGSSMQQQQCQQNTTVARSFFCDDDYVPSATNQPYSSCKSYVVIDSNNVKTKILQCKNKDEIREMASLTKMMTAMVTLELASDWRMDIRSTFFKVSQRASTTIGTTANLLEGQVLTIWELLHGLMLPSGNDAAMVLAENFSNKLLLMANRKIRENDDQPLEAPKCAVTPFVKLMNKTARRCHMRLTNYANPHGLADKANHSTALEQAYLANYAMRNEIFRGIVNSKTFTSINYVPLKRCQKMPHYDFNTWQSFDERDIPFNHGGVPYVQYYQTWYNSNKLLDVPGFCGVKTGQTSTAGACLAIFYKNTLNDKNLITVVLGSKSVEYRWKDTRRLTLWADAVQMEEIAQRTGGGSLSPTKSNRKATHSGARPLY